jgi:hypothetical protein
LASSTESTFSGFAPCCVHCTVGLSAFGVKLACCMPRTRGDHTDQS